MNWEPFVLCAEGDRPPEMRPFGTREGLGDRLRTAAFAERQATEAFLWAVARFEGAPAELRAAWREIAAEEKRHGEMILARMEQLGVAVAAMPVSDRLWRSLSSAQTPEQFAFLMGRSEERGRAAELSFQRKLSATDPATAAMFAEIAKDEERHIALAASYSGPRSAMS